MSSLFNLEGPVMRFMTKVCDLIILNFLYISNIRGRLVFFTSHIFNVHGIR